MLDTPGLGDKPEFVLDPCIIPQKWGGNMWTNSIDVQSSLMGLDKRANRDCLDQKEYKRYEVNTRPMTYPVNTQLTTEQSRVTHPAWMSRDLTQNHAYILLENPQEHAMIPFECYQSTRILERDNYKRPLGCIPRNTQEYTLPVFSQKNMHAGGQSMCTTSRNCEQISK
jgi:hypothetical protein